MQNRQWRAGCSREEELDSAEPTYILQPSPQGLVLTHKSGRWILGWLRSRSSSLCRPTPPNPSPRAQSGFWPIVKEPRGEGLTSITTDTRGGRRFAPLSRANIGSPFRAENRLAVRLSGIPCVQPEKIWDMLTPKGEGDVETEDPAKRATLSSPRRKPWDWDRIWRSPSPGGAKDL
jgi:hypothetical protein